MGNWYRLSLKSTLTGVLLCVAGAIVFELVTNFRDFPLVLAYFGACAISLLLRELWSSEGRLK